MRVVWQVPTATPPDGTKEAKKGVARSERVPCVVSIGRSRRYQQSRAGRFLLAGMAESIVPNRFDMSGQRCWTGCPRVRET